MKVHPRVVVGQVWQSNDNRVGRLRGVRIISPGIETVVAENIVTKKRSVINRDSFCTGARGWSLLKEAS